MSEFGDAEIASLVAPRGLTIEYSPVPDVQGPPQPTPGRRGGAAPGRLDDALLRVGREESAAAAALVNLPGVWQPAGDQRRRLAVRSGRPGRSPAFAAKIGATRPMDLSPQPPADGRQAFDPQLRQKRQVDQLTNHVQAVERQCERLRDQWFLGAISPKSADALTEGAKKYREVFRNEVIGALDDPLLPPNAQTRQIYDEPKWTGYDVVLDVWPDVHAWGMLCLPKDLKPGEKRPVVVCQHGLEGVPRDTIEKNIDGYRYYKAFAAELADRGFVTFAPYNLYRGEDRFRTLQRKANPLRASLFSIIVPAAPADPQLARKLSRSSTRRGSASTA